MAILLEYAHIDLDNLTFTGRTNLYVDGKELGVVPHLAICRNDAEISDGKDILLLHCDKDWSPIGCSVHATVEEAKRRAEGIYVGVSSRWKKDEET